MSLVFTSHCLDISFKIPAQMDSNGTKALNKCGLHIQPPKKKNISPLMLQPKPEHPLDRIFCIFPKAHAWLLVHLPSLTHWPTQRRDWENCHSRVNCHIETRHITAIFSNWAPAILCWVVFGDGMPFFVGLFSKRHPNLWAVLRHWTPTSLWTAWGSGCVQDGPWMLVEVGVSKDFF